MATRLAWLGKSSPSLVSPFTPSTNIAKHTWSQPRRKKSKCGDPYIISQFKATGRLEALKSCVQVMGQCTNLEALISLIDHGHGLLNDLRSVIHLRVDLFGQLLPAAVIGTVCEFLYLKEVIFVERVCRSWNGALLTTTLCWRRAFASQAWHVSALDLKINRSRHLPTRGLSSSIWRERVRNRLRLQRNWLQGQCSQQSLTYGPKVYALSFSGSTLAAGGSDSMIKVWDMKSWDMQTARCITILKGHTGEIWTLKADQKSILSGSADSTVRYWTWSSSGAGQCVRNYTGHLESVMALASNETRLVTGSHDRTVRDWDLETGTCRSSIEAHSRSIYALSLHGDRVLSGSLDGSIKEWDFVSGQCIRKLSSSAGVRCLYWPGGRQVVSGSTDGKITFWNLETNTRLQTLEGHQGYVRGVFLDGRLLVSGSEDRTIKIWNTESGERVRMRAFISQIGAIQCDSIHMVSGDHNGEIRICKFDEGGERKKM